MKIGMLFPGQGSQFVGMAKALFDEERIVQEYFDQASLCLDKNFVKLCFASSEKELMQTINTQTSIFVVSGAISSLLREKYSIQPHIVAGHSLGEYSAVYAAGGMNFADGIYLVNKRAHFMQAATQSHVGGMLAVLSFPEEALRIIVAKYNRPGDDAHVAEIVNHNAPDQLVVSGTLKELDLIRQDVLNQKGKAIMLKVAGAFHSRLLADAQKQFSAYLEKVDLKDLSVPLVSNVTAQPITTALEIKGALVEQISSPVLWHQSMKHFNQCDVIVEVGPGSKFAKLATRAFPTKTVISVNEQIDIDKLAAFVSQSS